MLWPIDALDVETSAHHIEDAIANSCEAHLTNQNVCGEHHAYAIYQQTKQKTHHTKSMSQTLTRNNHKQAWKLTLASP